MWTIEKLIDTLTDEEKNNVSEIIFILLISILLSVLLGLEGLQSSDLSTIFFGLITLPFKFDSTENVEPITFLLIVGMFTLFLFSLLMATANLYKVLSVDRAEIMKKLKETSERLSKHNTKEKNYVINSDKRKKQLIDSYKEDHKAAVLWTDEKLKLLTNSFNFILLISIVGLFFIEKNIIRGLTVFITLVVFLIIIKLYNKKMEELIELRKVVGEEIRKFERTI